MVISGSNEPDKGAEDSATRRITDVTDVDADASQLELHGRGKSEATAISSNAQNAANSLSRSSETSDLPSSSSSSTCGASQGRPQDLTDQTVNGEDWVPVPRRISEINIEDDDLRQQDLLQRYDSAVQRGISEALAIAPNRNWRQNSPEVSTVSSETSDLPSCSSSLLTCGPPALQGVPQSKTTNYITSPENCKIGDEVNVLNKFKVYVVEQKNNGDQNPVLESSEESAEQSPKKLRTIIKWVAGLVSVTLILVAIIAVVQVIQLRSSSSGGKPTYKPEVPKDDSFDVADGSGPGNISWVSRATCGLKNPSKYADHTNMSLPTDMVVISHTVTPECASQEKCCARVRSVQAYTMNYAVDIGFHFLVASDGNIYEGRDWTWQGAHTKGANCKFGVSFIGDFMDKVPIEKQVDAAFRLFDGLVSAGLLTPDYTIVGQKDVKNTESPGKMLIELMANWPHYKKKEQNVKSPCSSKP